MILDKPSTVISVVAFGVLTLIDSFHIDTLLLGTDTISVPPPRHWWELPFY